MAVLWRRTWRWFAVRVAHLPPDSAWWRALSPGSRTGGHRPPDTADVVIDDPDAVDAFFARQAA